MSTATCPIHPNVHLTANGWCWWHDQVHDPKEAPMDESTGTLTLKAGGKSVTVPHEAFDQRLEQMILSDTLFPPVRRADVPMVKLSISGTIELTREEYQSYLDGQRLGPGAVVEIRAVGYVVQPGAAWVKRRQKLEDGDTEEWFEREGRVKIRLVDLGALAATGEEWSE